jgi:hypothetical protein
MAEMLFMVEASNRGFGVAKPYGNNERYDVILDRGRRFWRVQVKGSGCEHNYGFTVKTCWRTTDGVRIPYSPEERSTFWRCRVGMYEKYREAWKLLCQPEGR